MALNGIVGNLEERFSMKTTYPAYPTVKATYRNTFVLESPYQVGNILIPAGYESDGLSLQFRIFRLVVSKYAPKFMPFFFIHDYLCDEEMYRLADNLGEEILFDIEKSWRTKIMIFLVRKYHKIKYGI